MSDASQARSKRRSAPQRRQKPSESQVGVADPSQAIRETIESIVIAFVLAFVFRAYIVEAFVIPTGSMAPTLLGRNVRVYCSQCGYHFKADPNDGGFDINRRAQSSLAEGMWSICPMCRFPNELVRGTRIYAGDRILIHKYIYSLSQPQRWDVVVFKNPENPDQNFIKRLVGLPGENLWVIEGNVYRKDIDQDRDGWQIARKSNMPKVQRAVWQPVYHSSFVPQDNGESAQRRPPYRWKVPWVAVGDTKDQWRIYGQRSYQYGSAEPGTIEFDFRCAGRGGVFEYPYNQLRSPSLCPEPIEDIRLAVAFQPRGSGLAVTLRTTARLRHVRNEPFPKIISATIDHSGKATLLCQEVSEDGITGRTEVLRAPEQVGRLLPHQTSTVELWHVDQQISLWIDGHCVLEPYDYELDMDVLETRKPLGGEHRYPKVSITVRGSPVTLHRVQLDRDLYYSSTSPGSMKPGTGTLSKRGSEPVGDPIDLAPGQLFCLGDNSPMSKDSRLWKTPNVWIKKRMMSDEPSPNGIVPARLMMGRAFFVYFPAPLGFDLRSMSVIPNFAEMRFIR